ncbi:alpha/beta-hydrolase [Saccharata proteae CBS 121410]|uniref:Alpha/beta-hydrolase n=1 Tax=Saccharata proteae CBS 121410 TaxID=1314787 RepID=A0A9P4HV04_9PEZI|nr:alpha/beta-hydrolase [Saccharata proteae CBS 121410]
MASNPPGKCCSVGVKHEGTATGKIEKIGGISTYVAYPADKSTSNAILILTDIIGHEFINAQLVADQYAANGYFVVMPDLFNGDPVPLNMKEINFDLMAWLQNHLPANVDPIVSTIIKELRSTFAAKRIGGVGYCFGGKYVCRFLKDGQLDVGYTAHPSFVDVDELKGIQGPLSISAAETDNIFPAEKRRETEDILKDMKVPYQMTLYSDVEHGFAVRCDIKEPRQRFAKEQAFFQAVQWFDEFLKQ